VFDIARKHLINPVIADLGSKRSDQWVVNFCEHFFKEPPEALARIASRADRRRLRPER